MKSMEDVKDKNKIRWVKIDHLNLNATRCLEYVDSISKELSVPASNGDQLAGEGTIKSIVDVFQRLQPDPESRFLDLGCGGGKYNYIANEQYQVALSVGIDSGEIIIQNNLRILHGLIYQEDVNKGNFRENSKLMFVEGEIRNLKSLVIIINNR